MQTKLYNIEQDAIHTFWYNPTNDNVMSEQDVACIASWQHQRNANGTRKSIYIWTYGKLNSVNNVLHDVLSNHCIEIRNAEEIIPRSEYFIADYKHIGAHGFAMFSDLFRYKMLDVCGGWWLDTDIFLINDTVQLCNLERLSVDKPLAFYERYSTGKKWLMTNNAAIWCHTTNLMNETYERCLQEIKKTIEASNIGQQSTIKWGNTGPILLSTMSDEGKYVSADVSHFYLIDFYASTGSLSKYAFTPVTSVDVVRFFKARPTGVHMWNSYLHKTGKIHPQSFFAICLRIAMDYLPINATTVIERLDNIERFIDVCDPSFMPEINK